MYGARALHAACRTSPHLPCDSVPVRKPASERFLAGGRDVLGQRSALRNLVEEAPGVAAVSAFHRRVRPGQRHRRGRTAVVHDQRMPQHRAVAARAHEGPGQLGALVHAPLDEDGEQRDRRLPRLRRRAQPQPVAVGTRFRQEPALLVLAREVGAREAEPLHHPQEQLGVRRGARQLPRLLLVQVLRQRHPQRLDRRHLTERAGEQDGKVAHVGGVLVPEVDQQLREREPRPRQRRVGPVVLAIHRVQEAFGERVHRP